VLREAEKKKSGCDREEDPIDPSEDVFSRRASASTIRIEALGGVE
jgi:hypothetical protein